MMKTIYLDNNATTAVRPEVLQKMFPFFCERYGNPSSIHSFGGSVAGEIEEARRQCAELLGARFRDRDNCASEIIFTSCGTESDNAAINAALCARPGRKKVVTSAVEHPAILHYCEELTRKGIEVVKVPVNEKGQLDMAFLEKSVDENTALVTLMWANNETGTIFPIAEAVKIAHKAGALCHSDAVQAAGKELIDVDELGIDFLSISGHKLHAPTGVGVLFVRRSVPFTPLIWGGHQERSRRGGTENAASIIGLGEACRLARLEREEVQVKLAALRDHLEEKVKASIPCIRINGDIEHRLCNTSSISFEFIEGESILMLLDMNGICASSGSACTTGSLEPSHVLQAMKVPYTAAHGTIRFSLSAANTAEEIDFTVECLIPAIARLRQISPYWKEEK